MKKWFVFILILLFSVAAVFAEETVDDLTLAQQSGVLKLGVSPDYIPFVFYENDTLTGMDVALMEEVGRRMGVKIQAIDIAFDGLIDALNIGQIDVIGGGLSVTEEREQIMDLTQFYYTGNSDFIALKSLPKPASNELSSYRDMRIGVEKGTIFDQWVKTNLVSPGYLSLRNVYTYSDLPSAMKALDQNVVDLVLMDNDVYSFKYEPTGNYQLFYKNPETERYAFGLRKYSTLTPVINKHLLDMFNDGTAQKIADSFFAKNYNEINPGISRPGQLRTPTPVSPIIVVPTKSPAANCTNGMIYISDITIPDNQKIDAGQHFLKTWRIRNAGTCTWTPSYSLTFVNGNQMSGSTINVPTYVSPGETVDLSVDLIAPYADGTYQGFWQMRNAQGAFFGQTIWVKIRVGNNANPTAAPQPWRPTAEPPQPWYPTTVPEGLDILSFYPDFYEGEEGTCVSVHWGTKGADRVDINVDGQIQYSDGPANGSTLICGPIQQSGIHNVQLYAYNGSEYAWSDFTFVTNDFIVY